MHQYVKHKNRIYFSRWSRKNYSLFACLGKEVIIGTLKYKLADAGIKTKQGSFFLRLLNSLIDERAEKAPPEQKFTLYKEAQYLVSCFFYGVFPLQKALIFTRDSGNDCKYYK
jgi:hypothetical protein